jgi:predicted dehydrogenase
MTVRWGVIGAGGHADRRFIPELLKTAKNSELVAVMDINPDALKRVAEKYDVPNAYDNEEDLASNDQVDVVYIATPQNLHHQQVLLAASHGKHVLCEKPLGISLEQVEEMMEACAKAGVKFGSDYNMRMNVYNQKAKELVTTGKLGQVVMGRAQLTCWYPPIPGAWRQDITISHGGSLIDMGTHCIDLLEYIIGTKAVQVTGFQTTLTHDYNIEDTSTILLEFANGAHGIVDNYFNVPDEAAKNFLEIAGTKGTIFASGTVGQDPTGTMTSILMAEEKGYQADQVRDEETGAEKVTYDLEPQWTYGTIGKLFAEAVEQDKEPPVPADVGYHNLKVVLAAYEAVRTGCTVDIE